jgi:hypothetical protein
MEGRVFVCHASEDAAAARAIVERLEARGVRCWIAPRDIAAGMNYTEAILAGLRTAPLVVFVFSDAANASPHVPRELERAADHGTRILPVRVGPAEPDESLRYLIGTAHWLDTVGVAPVVWLDQLAVAAASLLGSMGAPAVAPAPVPPPPPRVATYPPPPPGPPIAPGPPPGPTPGPGTAPSPGPAPAPSPAPAASGSGPSRATYLAIGALVAFLALLAIGLATRNGSDGSPTGSDAPSTNGTEASDGPDQPDTREVDDQTGLTDAEQALVDRLSGVDEGDCVRADAPGADAAVSCALSSGAVIDVASFASTADADDYWEAARGGLISDPYADYCDDGYEGPLPDTNGSEVGKIRCASEDGGGKAVAQWVDDRNDVVVTARSEGDLSGLLTDAIVICCS